MVTTRPHKTIVKPTALGPVANTDTKLLIYGLFQKGRVLAQDGIRSRLSLEQAWHGVHFLMCETADKAPAPLGNAVLGGSEVGPDEGFGPVRFLTPDQVVNVATAITELRAADLRRRWNPGALSDAQVYPGAWDDEDSLEWMINAFTELREFYVHAGENGSAVLIYVT